MRASPPPIAGVVLPVWLIYLAYVTLVLGASLPLARADEGNVDSQTCLRASPEVSSRSGQEDDNGGLIMLGGIAALGILLYCRIKIH